MEAEDLCGAGGGVPFTEMEEITGEQVWGEDDEFSTWAFQWNML